MRLSTLHQFVIGGAAVGGGLSSLYAALIARRDGAPVWIALAIASAGASLALVVYLRRFRATHR